MHNFLFSYRNLGLFSGNRGVLKLAARITTPRFAMDDGKITKFIDQCWEDSIVPTLSEYIRIPNKSPAFDPEWEAHGYMSDAVKLLEKWARDHVTAFADATVD